MTWGTELWDQFGLVADHAHQGIEFIEKTSKFVKERCEIEAKYAKDLRRLAKSYVPKKKEEDGQQFSFHRAFLGVVKETDDLAGQHELITENMMTSVYKELQSLHNELKLERRKCLSEGRKVQESLEQVMKAMDVSKKMYEKASSEAEQALLAYQKADQDMANSRLTIEKFKTVSMEKGQTSDRARDEYKNQLDKANSKQTLHYSSEMPAVFDSLQSMEERRIKRLGELLVQYSDVECKVMPIKQTCLENMKRSGSSVDGPKDTQSFADMHKTALEPPGDLPFEEKGGKSQTIPRTQNAAEKTKKKGLFTRKKKKHDDAGVDGNDFQTMTPGQKIRTCKKKLSVYEAQVEKLKSSREAMEKMVDVYQQNPSLGDSSTIEQQLNENAKELDAANVELHKYQCYLAALENRDAPAAPLKLYKSSGIQPPPAPTDDVPPPPAPGPPAALVPPVEEPSDDEFREDDEIQCRMLYAFQGTNEGELAVHDGEILIVLEPDNDNSGWTKVLRNDEEGYVPTAYIEVLD